MESFASQSEELRYPRTKLILNSAESFEEYAKCPPLTIFLFRILDHVRSSFVFQFYILQVL